MWHLPCGHAYDKTLNVSERAVQVACPDGRSYSRSRSSPVLKEAARQLTPNHASNLPSPRRDCRSYRTVRPSVWTHDLDRAFTNVLRLVVRMRTQQVPHRQASTPRDVSDQAFPPLINFYCVLHCTCGGRPGKEAKQSLYRKQVNENFIN